MALACTIDQVYSDCCGGCGYSFSTKDELQRAVIYFRDDAMRCVYCYGLINCWDVSKITDMSEIFREAYYGYSEDSLNEPIECWDVSRVTNMSYMFAWASGFNQPLNNWDVSSVTDMSYMLSSFN
jgi:surface protein